MNYNQNQLNKSHRLFNHDVYLFIVYLFYVTQMNRKSGRLQQILQLGQRPEQTRSELRRSKQQQQQRKHRQSAAKIE